MNKAEELQVYEMLLAEQCAEALAFFQARYDAQQQRQAEQQRKNNTKWRNKKKQQLQKEDNMKTEWEKLQVKSTEVVVQQHNKFRAQK